jgi:hypothetical protein
MYFFLIYFPMAHPANGSLTMVGLLTKKTIKSNPFVNRSNPSKGSVRLCLTISFLNKMNESDIDKTGEVYSQELNIFNTSEILRCGTAR